MDRKPWAGILNQDSEFHVIPIADFVTHELVGDACVCGPRVEPRERGVLYVHHSLDGREQNEPRSGQENDS